MSSRRKRLDNYALRAAPITDDQAVQIDPHAKRALFDAIVAAPLSDADSPTDAAPVLRHTATGWLPWGRRPVLVAAVTGLAAVGAVTALALSGVLGSGNVPVPPPVVSGPVTLQPGDPADALGGGAAMSCVEEYGAQTLANRVFAFDGTVVEIGTQPSSDVEADPYVPVTFQVRQWFRGGGADRVTVAMFPPGQITSVGNADYGIGDRLLVAGEPRWGGAPLDDPIAWACGFTRRYDPEVARGWAQVFASR